MVCERSASRVSVGGRIKIVRYYRAPYEDQIEVTMAVRRAKRVSKGGSR